MTRTCSYQRCSTYTPTPPDLTLHQIKKLGSDLYKIDASLLSEANLSQKKTKPGKAKNKKLDEVKQSDLKNEKFPTRGKKLVVPVKIVKKKSMKKGKKICTRWNSRS